MTTKNPATKTALHVVATVLNQLQTVEGARELQQHYLNAANEQIGAVATLSHRRAKAAAEQVAYLINLEKIKMIDKVIKQDKDDADAVVVAAEKLVDVRQKCLLQVEAERASTVAKIQTLQQLINDESRSHTGAVEEARTEFDKTMATDDDVSQVQAAEKLSHAETTLHLFAKSGANVIRLNGLKTREVQESERVTESRKHVDVAREALNQALLVQRLVCMDAAVHGAVVAYAEMMHVHAKCDKRPWFLGDFESIAIWAHSDRRVITDRAHVKDESICLRGVNLQNISKNFNRPDLSVFADEI